MSLVPAIAVGVATLSAPIALGATERVTPGVHDVFLRDGHGDRFAVTVDLESAPPSLEPLDVLYLFDVTGSMGNVIDTVRDRALEIMESVLSLSQNTTFAVASFTDYQSPIGPWVLHTDFTPDAAAARDVLASVSLRANDGNNDIPEAYARALFEASQLTWRSEAARYLILFGDAPAHDRTFYGENYGVDRGRDGRIGTADDLGFAEVVDSLAKAGVHGLVIYDESKGGSWFGGGGLTTFRDHAVMGFNHLANATGGIAYPVRDAGEIPAAIKLALRESFRPRPALSAAGTWAQWVTIGEPQALDEKRTRYRFDVELTPPPGTPDGIHRFPLLATHAGEIGGAEIGYCGVTVRIGWWNYPWRTPAVAAYLLLLLLALAGLAASRRRGVPIPYFRNAAAWRVVWTLALVAVAGAGLYAVWLLAPGTVPPFAR